MTEVAFEEYKQQFALDLTNTEHSLKELPKLYVVYKDTVNQRKAMSQPFHMFSVCER